MAALTSLISSFLPNHSVSADLKTGIILPLFKGKGVKANNKSNYRGITVFPTLTKIYEMVLLNRLEKFACENAYFSNLQFRFYEGVGCLEASFIILESINHMLERGQVKLFACFLDVRKSFDTVFGLTGCYTSFSRSLVSNTGGGGALCINLDWDAHLWIFSVYPKN